MMFSPTLTIVIFFVAWVITWLPIALPLAKLIDYQIATPLTVKQKILFLVSLYPLAPLIMWLIIRQEGFSFAQLGVSEEMFISLLRGLVLGLATLIIVFFLESILGLVNWHWENRQKLLAVAPSILVLALAIALVEEIVFRGFIVRELSRDYSYWLAAIISSLIFALMHLVWERKTTLPQIPGLWLMGIVLVTAVLVDNGSLGLAWGLHTGWIWGLSCLDSAQILTYSQPEHPWLTGINQEPLAGVAGILCLFMTLGWLLLGKSLIIP